MMSHNIGNINKNMDNYLKIMLKKGIISARLCFVRVSSRAHLTRVSARARFLPKFKVSVWYHLHH